MTGARGQAGLGATATTKATPVLQARNLVKRYGRVVAIDGSDPELYPNDILAVIGDNGAGKSCLIKAPSGHSSRTAAGFSWTASRCTSPIRWRPAPPASKRCTRPWPWRPAWTSPTTFSWAAKSARPVHSDRYSGCWTRAI